MTAEDLQKIDQRAEVARESQRGKSRTGASRSLVRRPNWLPVRAPVRNVADDIFYKVVSIILARPYDPTIHLTASKMAAKNAVSKVVSVIACRRFHWIFGSEKSREGVGMGECSRSA